MNEERKKLIIKIQEQIKIKKENLTKLIPLIPSEKNINLPLINKNYYKEAK